LLVADFNEKLVNLLIIWNTEVIRKNSEIWQALEKSVKTSEMLEIDKPPELKSVINEIFT
jgi:ssDNA-specific exonuclease RecJ